MRLRQLMLASALAMLTACGANQPPIVVMIVTATPQVGQPIDVVMATPAALSPTPTDANEVEVFLTATAFVQAATDAVAPQVTAVNADANPIEAVTATAIIAGATASAEAASPLTAPTAAAVERTALPVGFPTPVIAQIQVAEQLFERGRMFWVEPTGELWVITVTREGGGDWLVFPDTYTEGDAESDPSLVPPAGLQQPLRGFGKLWRESQEVRDALGWAVTPEFGYVSRYEYYPGGTMDANGQYEAGPGYHVLYSLYSEQFRFNEIDATWQLGGA